MRFYPNIIFAILILSYFDPIFAQSEPDTTYYADGGIKSIGVLIDGERDGRWFWYHQNGEKCGKEEYLNGKLQKTKYWDKFGKKSDNSEVRTSPEYPGGLNAFRSMVESNLTYPEHLEKEGKKGRTILQFTVDTLGNVVNPVVVKTAHPDFDKEALRVIMLSKQWKPGTFHGEVAETIFTFPVNFEFEKTSANI